jgi:hypothetical protein
MNAAIELLELGLKQAKEQEIIINARIERGENVYLNKENLKENQNEIDDIEKALSFLRRSYL